MKDDSNTANPPRTFDIEVFDGDFKKWPQFRDQYLMLIHSNDKLTPVEKLKHLKNLVSGSASNIIADWQVTDWQITNDSYSNAFDKLAKVYDNVNQIARCHIQEIFDAPNSHNGESLQQLTQTIGNAYHKLG